MPSVARMPPFFSAMLERFILSVATSDPGLEEPAATRERLKATFPPGAARRMTQLGMLVGEMLETLGSTGQETLVYSSAFGESRALEEYLTSFPDPSPTLFQTSIHPSGVQQSLIGKKRSVREVFPLSGGDALPVNALLLAMTAPASRVLWVGGEERGTWLREKKVASERTFAFGLALGAEPTETALGRIVLSPGEGLGRLPLPTWFDLLQARRAWTGQAAAGWNLSLTWA
jgi:hypothetical protein